MFKYCFLITAAAAGIASGQTCPFAGYVLSGRANGNLFPAEGRVEVLTLQTPPGCPWQITNLAPWTYVLGPTSGTDTANIEIGVATNPTTASRSQAVVIGGRIFPVIQAAAPAPCAFTLQPTSTTAPDTGSGGTIQLNASASTCGWAAFATRRWVQFYPISGTGTTNISYTVFPNFSPGPRTAIGSIADQQFSFSQLGAPGTFNERLVRLLYFNFFGRLPSSSEVAFHLQNLSSGMTTTDLAFNFMNSPEFNLVGRFIAGLYVGLLVRDAEFGGWLFQRNAVITGAVGLTPLVSNFLGSAEYVLKFGTPTDAEFVQLLYTNVLFRQPSPSELQFHTGGLSSGITRAQLVTNFLNTPEFQAGRGARLTAFIIYAALLTRDPNFNELATRVQQIQANPSNPDAAIRAILQEILSSPEFLSALN